MAQEEPAPQPTIAYHDGFNKDFKIDGKRQSLVMQLVIPAQGDYTASAKLTVRKAKGAKYPTGTVTCFLGAIGRGDRSVVSLRPGETASMSLSTAGRAAASSVDTQAADLACETKNSAYIVSGVRMTAIKVDDVETIGPDDL